MGDERQDDQLRAAFEAAAVDPSRWLDALRVLGDATGSMRGQLIGIGGAHVVPFNWANDMSPEVTEEFVAMGGGSPDINYRVTVSEGMKVGDIASDADYARAIPGLKSDVYLEFCERVDLPYGIQAKVMEGPDGLIGLAALRGRHDGPASEAQCDTFRRAVPFVHSAVRIQRALESQGALLVAGTLEAMDCAAFVLDDRAAVRATTPRADAMLRDGTALRVIAGQLIPVWPLSRDAFDRALAQALAGNGGHGCVDVAIRSGPAGEEPVAVSFVTLPGQPWSLQFRPRVIAVVRRPRSDDGAAVLLADAFGLTTAEARVALMIADGKSRAEIAAARGVAMATVLAQIKSIFAKTGLGREAALVARLRDLIG